MDALLDKIEREIAVVVAADIDVSADGIHSETEIRNAGFESLRVTRLVARLERKYGVEFDDTLFAKVKTIGELADAVRALRR